MKGVPQRGLHSVVPSNEIVQKVLSDHDCSVRVVQLQVKLTSLYYNNYINKGMGSVYGKMFGPCFSSFISTITALG